MDNLTSYWVSPSNEQQTIAKEVHKQAIAQEPGQMPVRSTLLNALELETELAVCASELFIMVVQDRGDLGGGYGVQIIALDKLINRHFDTLEEVEVYLDENAPYTAHSPVWMPLPAYNSHKHETELLIKINK